MNTPSLLHIAYDAKRAFFNRSGLGNYSRDLVRVLSELRPDNKYYLFKPKDKEGIHFSTASNTITILPKGKFYNTFGSLWRAIGISKEIKKYPINIYHGLSHDLPFGIQRCGVKTVVTIHDCIYKRFPELYDRISPIVYTLKQQYACNIADRIIAISEQTKQDIIKYYKVPEEKITVVYQGCNIAFYKKSGIAEKERIKAKYNLPEKFILNVGTIEERKNLLSILKALVVGSIDFPVVVVGPKTKYFETVSTFAEQNKLEVTFIHNVDFLDLPCIYQLSEVFIYPSKFEGFGIPILEALNSETPTITTKGGVFPEVGGDAARYVSYGNTAEMIEAITTVLSDSTLRTEMIEKGKKQALKFKEQEIANNLMKVYSDLVES